MMKPYSVLAVMALSSTLSAQTWTVGTPASMILSEVTAYGGGCYPDIQTELHLNYTPVDGMQYYYEVSNIQGGGFYTMVPGPANALNIGDTVHVPANGISFIYNQQVQGGLTLRLMAEGTPTTAGQTYPCTQNDLWMSNLMLCDEWLNKTLGTNCTVQPGSTQGIADISGASAWYASNGNNVRLIDPTIRTAQLIDMQGRVVATTNSSGGVLELGSLPTGMYIVRAQRAEGAVLAERVMLAH